MLSIEELLKPRYKVIADYPNNDDYNVGDVITFVREVAQMYEECENQRNEVLVFKYGIDWLKKWPHLFNPLAWYEERKEEDMPEYVKYVTGNSVHKVIGWRNSAEMLECRIENVRGAIYAKHFEPTTEQEYLNYINKTT